MLLCIWSTLFFSACSEQGRQQTDTLNELSYAYHYRNLDSTELYARKALSAATHYDAGKAEAFNNLAFVNIARMDFVKAAELLDSAINITDNQVELMVAEIQYMRLCQRKAQNKEFYDYKERALQRLKRINEERDNLFPHTGEPDDSGTAERLRTEDEPKRGTTCKPHRAAEGTDDSHKRSVPEAQPRRV